LAGPASLPHGDAGFLFTEGGEFPCGKGPVQPPAAGDEAGAVHSGGKAADGGVSRGLLFRGAHISGRGGKPSVGGIRLQAFGELPRGVEAAPFVRHADGTHARLPPCSGIISGCGSVRRVCPDAVPVRPVADIPERAPPNHGGIGPAGCQGFTAGDGRSGRRDFRYSRGTGSQTGGEDEQRQGIGHPGSMASGLRGGKDDCWRTFFIQGTDGLEA